MNSATASILAFDYGTRKIGVAVGQHITGTASPLAAITARDGVPDWDGIEALLQQWQPAECLVGIPFNMDGSESEMSARARRFANQLRGRFGLICHEVDERLSSREARDAQRQRDQRRGRKHDPRTNVDSLAACVILEAWLAL